jgi:hypothetical protein
MQTNSGDSVEAEYEEEQADKERLRQLKKLAAI